MSSTRQALPFRAAPRTASPKGDRSVMPQELTTQKQFDAFADAVARELGTHCRTVISDRYGRGLARLIIDGEGRALNLWQPDGRRPARLRVHAALPEEAEVPAASIGVTSISAPHVAHEIIGRLYPLHTAALKLTAQLTTRKEAEARERRAVADAVANALPGAHIQERYRRTDVYWQRASRPLCRSGAGSHTAKLNYY